LNVQQRKPNPQAICLLPWQGTGQRPVEIGFSLFEQQRRQAFFNKYSSEL